MKPTYWKYTFEISTKLVVVYKHRVEGNNINHLKAVLPMKKEMVEEFPVSIPLEEYESFREWNDWGAFSVSEKFGKTSLGKFKRPNQEMVTILRNQLNEKYPLEAI